MVGTTGPMGSGLPQFGLPRRFAMFESLPAFRVGCFPAVHTRIFPPDEMLPISLDSIAPLRVPLTKPGAFPGIQHSEPYVGNQGRTTMLSLPRFSVQTQEKSRVA